MKQDLKKRWQTAQIFLTIFFKFNVIASIKEMAKISNDTVEIVAAILAPVPYDALTRLRYLISSANDFNFSNSTRLLADMSCGKSLYLMISRLPIVKNLSTGSEMFKAFWNVKCKRISKRLSSACATTSAQKGGNSSSGSLSSA